MTAHWQDQPEGGGRSSIRFVIAAALRSGRGFMRICLYPITLYYFLRRGAERRASRRIPNARVRSSSECMGGAQAPVLFRRDAGRSHLPACTWRTRFRDRSERVEQLQQRVAEGRGVLLIGSHQGSFEVLRTLSARCPDVPLRVLLDKQKTPAMTEFLEALAPEVGEAVIDVSQGGAAIALAVAETCRTGGMVALLADRGRAHEVLRRVEFLGQPAPFPTGPWLLANTLQVPVMLCFGMYRGGRRYTLNFEPFAERVEIPREGRNQALDDVLRRYAGRLEHYARLEPYNWFNFYDFWQDDDREAIAPVRVSSMHEA